MPSLFLTATTSAAFRRGQGDERNNQRCWIAQVKVSLGRNQLGTRRCHVLNLIFSLLLLTVQALGERRNKQARIVVLHRYAAG